MENGNEEVQELIIKLLNNDCWKPLLRFELFEMDNKYIFEQKMIYPEEFEFLSEMLDGDDFSSMQILALASKFAEKYKAKHESEVFEDLRASADLASLILGRGNEMIEMLTDPKSFPKEIFPRELDAPVKYDLIRQLKTSIDEYQSLLLFAGETKSGKSSLINAFLGVKLLPVASTQCTSTILEVVHCDYPYMQFFRDYHTPRKNFGKLTRC